MVRSLLGFSVRIQATSSGMLGLELELPMKLERKDMEIVLVWCCLIHYEVGLCNSSQRGCDFPLISSQPALAYAPLSQRDRVSICGLRFSFLTSF